jgi:uncharacterized SAM-binding protein YcdF (DUF218 family)
MNEEVLRLARIIWDYHWVQQEAVPADVIIALGTNDLRVAEFAADLFLRSYGATLVCTGGVAHKGDLLETSWEKTEAEMYADVAISRGVPRERILLETHATNTAENIRFARDMLSRREIRPRNIVLAVKPFMRRRVWATLPIEWPEIKATIASPQMTLDEYFTDELGPDKIINIMMGDLQRLWVYARKGWSAPQPLPAEVREAYLQLAALGFTKHLIAEE